MKLRQAVLGITLLGMAGLAAELWLLEHTDSLSQWVPLIVLFLGLGGGVAALVRPTRRVLLGFRLLMAGFIIAGGVGLYLHIKGNVEFELELNASARGFELLREALMGATPALAPGALAQLGLFGLAFTFRHPSLRLVQEGRRHAAQGVGRATMGTEHEESMP